MFAFAWFIESCVLICIGYYCLKLKMKAKNKCENTVTVLSRTGTYGVLAYMGNRLN